MWLRVNVICINVVREQDSRLPVFSHFLSRARDYVFGPTVSPLFFFFNGRIILHYNTVTAKGNSFLVLSFLS